MDGPNEAYCQGCIVINISGVSEASAVQTTLVVVIENLQLVLVRVAKENPGNRRGSESSDD